MGMDKDMLLAELLDCGYADLKVVTDSKYEISTIMEFAEEYDEGKVNLQKMFRAIVDCVITDLSGMVTARYMGLREDLEEVEFDEDQTKAVLLQDQISKLEKMKPEDDITYYFNYLDSHIIISKNEEDYRNMFEVELETLENMSGFNFE